MTSPQPAASTTSAARDKAPWYKQKNQPSSSPGKLLMETEVPTIDACIVHLKLLAAIADLRDQVSATDGLFGLSDRLFDKFESQRDRYRAAAIIREKRWQIYVCRAVDRFEAWMDRGIETGRIVSVPDIEAKDKKYSTVTDCDGLVPFTVDTLPPLDVIMVWHAYMLNPRNYLEDCLRRGKMSLWATGMPWDAINDALDTDFNFIPGEKAIGHFAMMTDRLWDNLLEPPTKPIPCPKCQVTIHAQWASGSHDMGSLDLPFEQSKGYADKNFRVTCSSCRLIITHDTLRVAKFRRDMDRLSTHQIPMPGTLLSLTGVPETARWSFHAMNANMMLPNKLLSPPSHLHEKLLSCTDYNSHPAATIEDIRDAFKDAFKKERSLLRKARVTSPVSRHERISIRRLMSRYWENSSPFALDLVGAVIRQGTFITKMDSIDWIHSPTLSSTMTNLLEKYKIFMRIISTRNGTLGVPTLDVDLAWHTHQLWPQAYFRYSLHATRGQTFIDHDDKVDQNTLNDAFERTSRRYQEITRGKLYSECVCWYCEAIREAHSSYFLFGHTKSEARERTEKLRDAVPDDPVRGNLHISAHNAVNIFSGIEEKNREKRKKKVDRNEMTRMRLEKLHEKAVRRIEKRNANSNGNGKQKKKKKNENGNSDDGNEDRDEEKDAENQDEDEDGNENENARNVLDAAGYYPIIYGYPVYVPEYIPYAVDPAITPELYPSNPACVSGVGTMDGSAGLVDGEQMYGGCVPATCSTEAALGSCGGGGVGGGCGGGGGGGGGSGGGCGGGGGGCGGGGGGGGGD
ncbi:hypothetical protein FQN55_001234 [Onygenales sp. PD_40]|nr:hypothetical protein FQN55_001234 [Onygenales sp. PD_40]